MSRASTLLTLLKVFLLVLFVASTNHGVGARILEFWARGYWLALVVFLGIWSLALLALTISAFLPRLWVRLCWAVPIALSTLAGAVVFSIARVQLSLFEVVLYWSERAHWGDALESYSAWLYQPLLLVLVGIVAMLLPVTIRLPRVRLLYAVPLTPILATSVLLIHQGGEGTRALPEQFNAISMTVVLVLGSSQFDSEFSRESVALDLAGSPPVDHVILIVDESVRADFLDLNLERGVTPFLRSRGESIANFGYAVSASNCSLFSNLTLRFGGTPERVSESIRSGPSIWSYAHAAGFRTVYVDAQYVGGALQNGMTAVERGTIDEFVQFDGFSRPERDHEAARELRRITSSPDRHFVYVNKNGSHFPYIRNYPRQAAPFEPDMEPGEALGRSRERLLNSYKNSIRWTVDGFFRELLSDDLSNTVVIYTSDHGQNLMDRGVVFQCDSSDPHFLEGLVPLLVLTGDQELAVRVTDAAARNRGRATHFEIFPTLLELFGFERSEVASAYGEGLLGRLGERSRRFSYGPIAGYPGREVRWKEMPPDLAGLQEARESRPSDRE